MAKKVQTKKDQKFLRPPVVTIMGHVDHGKTTLLDYIRKTNIAAKEFGGITQHIGAYQVKVKNKNQEERYITFIDTPGHEAFLKMRARGAEVTDIVVLVVAANDGVMPQTIESISHIKNAKVPYLVAINKIDLEEADIEKVKRQLAKNDVLVEGYGGNVVCVNISAKTGKGVDELLEMIILLAEMNSERFQVDLKGELEAYVIESKMEKNIGPLATILIKNGILKVGDKVIIDDTIGKIRAMKNEWGENLTSALPSMPVEVLGLKKVPNVGAKVKIIKEEEEKLKRLKEEKNKKITAVKRDKEEKKEEFLKVILKADTFGSLEALTYSLPKEIEIYHQGIGDITETDILLAKTVKAVVLGFNVKIPKSTEKLAETEKVLVKNYNIIYELLDEIKEVILEMKKPKPKEKIIGKAKIIADFLGTSGRIAGCKVIEGRIKYDDTLRVEREGKEVMNNLKIISMKHLKNDVKQVSMGMECGIIFSQEVDFRIGDVIISYRSLED